MQRVSAQPFGGRDAADLLRSATCSATVSVRLGTDCKEAAEKGVLTMLKSRRLLQGPGGGQALRLFVHEHVPVTLVIRFTLHVLLLSGGDAATSKESRRSMTRLDEAQFGACVSFLPWGSIRLKIRSDSEKQDRSKFKVCGARRISRSLRGCLGWSCACRPQRGLLTWSKMPRRRSCQGVVAELLRLLSLLVVGHVHRCCRSQDASQAVWAVVR